jgi:diaminopimelate epimerase
MTGSFQRGVIPFVKASACGNDFIIIDGMYAPPDIAGVTRRVCDRHMGVGADGVEWLFPAQDADTEARLLNADGSEAEISGNGTRCVAAFLCAEKSKEKLLIRTGAGLKTCTLTSCTESSFEFETEMGRPIVGAESVLTLEASEVRGISVSMGNPHFVVIVKGFASDWQAKAGEIGKSKEFKHGVNVEFVVVRDRQNIEARFFERGVGETQSSGTGSCAAAVASIAAGKAQSPVRIHAPGGAQMVRWEDLVFLRGPAELICRGEFFV